MHHVRLDGPHLAVVGGHCLPACTGARVGRMREGMGRCYEEAHPHAPPIMGANPVNHQPESVRPVRETEHLLQVNAELLGKKHLGC